MYTLSFENVELLLPCRLEKNIFIILLLVEVFSESFLLILLPQRGFFSKIFIERCRVIEIIDVIAIFIAAMV